MKKNTFFEKTAAPEPIHLMTEVTSILDSICKLLPQETVKQEIEKGLGTQFNPKWGKIMLKLIEKDKDYKMHQ